LPITIQKRKGKLNYYQSAGGLATGLSTFCKSPDCIWIGWPGFISDVESDKIDIKKSLLSKNMYPVFLSKSDVKKYYEGFCNGTVWPLFHYFNQYAVYDNELWGVYRRVNNVFCKKMLEIVKPGDVIWIHDFHLLMLPGILREKLPDATIGFFLHIPFPSFEIFRTLPWRNEILSGILGSDLIGFHTYDYAQHFLNAVNRLLGIEHVFNQLTVDDRIIKVDSFPMGIDYYKYSDSIENPAVQRKIKKYRKGISDRKIVLSINRLDYSKGILQSLQAFDLFLEINPEYREKVTLVLVIVPSRSRVRYYRELKKRIDEFVGQINSRYGTTDWTPILYFYRSLPFSELSAFYCIADIALVTPFRDGMNLIAKEYIASKRDKIGVLILSETAGASLELGDALIINPNNIDEIADALKVAVNMPKEEQIKRNTFVQNRLIRNDVKRWGKDFMDSLHKTKRLQSELRAKRINDSAIKELVKRYISSKKRLIFLDYDGTLVPFTDVPEKAKPDDELLKLIWELADHSGTEVVIISGRDKDTLQKWFGKIDISLVAEHGAILRGENNKWEMIEPLSQEWKKEILPIMEFYEDRTPGSFIEDKEFSLVWHYRKTDTKFGEMRARELVETINYLIANMNLQLLEGSKVVEVKNSEISKGRTALHWIEKNKADFILAIGDDWTDEDIFSVLPDWAYSIKVGHGSSAAKFRIKSPMEVRQLLKAILERDKK
jgi:trehalose 6-phosphate synthase/phosphatase